MGPLYLLKSRVGIKDALLVTGASKNEFDEIKEEYTSQLEYYNVSEDYIKKILNHFIDKTIRAGYAIPVEMAALKNLLQWDDLRPEEYNISLPKIKKVKYYPRDIRQFPFDTWWLEDSSVFNILRPYKSRHTFEIPEELLKEVSKIYHEYAKKEIAPACSLCADIIMNSTYRQRTKLISLFTTIKDELLNVPFRLGHSPFLDSMITATIENTLYNLNHGYSSTEFIE